MPLLYFILGGVALGGATLAFKVGNDEMQETLNGVATVFDKSKEQTEALRQVALAAALIAGVVAVGYYASPLLKK